MIVLLLLACSQPPPVEAARYTLAWNTEGLIQDEEGLLLTTDEGFTVRLESGSLTTYGMSLVACEDQLARRASPIASAHAGHGEQADPSTWARPLTQDFGSLEPSLYGELLFTPSRYCGVHYLIYAASEATERAGAEDVDTSLRIRAEVLSPVQRRLELSTAAGHGALLDLPEPAGEGGVLELVVRRNLAGIFDGIDLGEASDEDITWDALGNLADVDVQASLTGDLP